MPVCPPTQAFKAVYNNLTLEETRSGIKALRSLSPQCANCVFNALPLRLNPDHNKNDVSDLDTNKSCLNNLMLSCVISNLIILVFNY